MCPEGGDPYSLIYSKLLELLLNEGPESMSEWMNGWMDGCLYRKTEFLPPIAPTVESGKMGGAGVTAKL